MGELSERLRRLELWREEEEEASDSPRRRLQGDDLLALAAAGRLVGGLAVATDVRPDELFGPLCAAVGGSARALRVLDVRERPRLELALSFQGRELRWKVPGMRELVKQLNALLAADADARAVAVLGERDESLLLWCVPKSRLRALLQEEFFQPENRGVLKRVVAAGRE